MDVAPTLAFARRLAALRRRIWIRFVLVPGLTDDMDDLAKTAEFAAGLGNVERVEVLPFHQMGRFKWNGSASTTRSRDVAAPTAEAVEQACAVLRRAGLQGRLAFSAASATAAMLVGDARARRSSAP
jgi:pyruvate formate lyase activating enzyme